jgi:ABC-type sugar transport system substrate-binding protein
MPMTPERVVERVNDLVESIQHALSAAFAEHNAATTIEYIRQVRDLGIISAAQFETLVNAVNTAADSWVPVIDANGRPLDG